MNLDIINSEDYFNHEETISNEKLPVKKGIITKHINSYDIPYITIDQLEELFSYQPNSIRKRIIGYVER